MHALVDFLVQTIGSLGLVGIFFLMFLESSFFPFPSEVVMIPAGYLASSGEMNLFLVIAVGVAGSLAGAWFNYLLAHRFGRNLMLRFMSEERVEKLDRFFENHGHISTFTGRLIPGLRQYISFPAGLARMPTGKFTLYTTLGALIWVTILTLLGYVIGQQQELIHRYLREITVITLIAVALLLLTYIVYWRKNHA